MISPKVIGVEGTFGKEGRFHQIIKRDTEGVCLQSEGQINKQRILTILGLPGTTYSYIVGPWEIPFKNEEKFTGYVIFPRSTSWEEDNGLFNNLADDTKKVSQALEFLYKSAPSPKIQEKYAHTRTFISRCQSEVQFMKEHREEILRNPSYKNLLNDILKNNIKF